ncbi:hypothetical protein GCM10023083_11320 [Streptomyces phyllanthi]
MSVRNSARRDRPAGEPGARLAVFAPPPRSEAGRPGSFGRCSFAQVSDRNLPDCGPAPRPMGLDSFVDFLCGYGWA